MPDAEFFFLRVVGLRKVCSRADVAIRLKASMGSEKAFSNWSEGIDVNDLEDRFGKGAGCLLALDEESFPGGPVFKACQVAFGPLCRQYIFVCV